MPNEKWQTRIALERTRPHSKQHTQINITADQQNEHTCQHIDGTGSMTKSEFRWLHGRSCVAFGNAGAGARVQRNRINNGNDTAERTSEHPICMQKNIFAICSEKFVVCAQNYSTMPTRARIHKPTQNSASTFPLEDKSCKGAIRLQCGMRINKRYRFTFRFGAKSNTCARSWLLCGERECGGFGGADRVHKPEK